MRLAEELDQKDLHCLVRERKVRGREWGKGEGREPSPKLWENRVSKGDTPWVLFLSQVKSSIKSPFVTNRSL